jgi:hypothetical protein
MMIIKFNGMYDFINHYNDISGKQTPFRSGKTLKR